MKINDYIDHTLLKADARVEQIEKLVKEAKKYKFKSVCVNSSFVKYIRNMDKDIRITSVVGFPLGAMSTKAKAFEAKCAIEDGADEIDMVINVGRLKDKDYDYILNDIKEVRKASKDKILKVIIETCLLNDEEKVKICELSKEAKADFVKTSTGFSTAGAKKEDVALMRKTVGDDLGVKASGGIHTYAEAIEMIEAGANRLGSSASVAIVKGEENA
ncbi:deoxyribose-phosphate aldolase [Anaerococcus porci]|uniref:Deoxyribose-phosphate aldolase n=1 Tax=Anaerococcus porci TaxID=2652269 RepID=A0A6N7VVF7_9FIRM|nr:deoxyribose-phosphate aldolase [Anaerococcus porci]MDY3006478.1 deoxyribose-phosphate aldolase [Anaerococcus porci]MSS78004.1 deoxyribose-phosphate aldolase [Anaerococcus porci]